MRGRPPAPAAVITPTGYRVDRSAARGPAGSLIVAARQVGTDRLLGSGARWRFLYRSVGTAGESVVVSGLVLLPRGSPPVGGWPVIAWAHGTTGLADQCAPSVAPQLGYDGTAVKELRPLLKHWAVVATDYPGLGTPGVHPYLVGTVNGEAVVQSVVAARHLLGHRLARQWVVAGHSEGGQSALFAAQVARHDAPGLDYRGAVALAPASLLEAIIPLTDYNHDPGEQSYVIYALVGLHTVDPTVRIERLLTRAARPVLPDLGAICLDPMSEHLGRLHPPNLLTANPATKQRLNRELGAIADPDRRPTTGPVLVLQGTTDTDVPAGATTAMVGRMCRLHDGVQVRMYTGANHEQLIPRSISDQARWIRDRFAGRPARSTCPRP